MTAGTWRFEVKGLLSRPKPWPALASAVLLFLAFPPAGLVLLVFVAVAPWLASLRTTDGRGAIKSGAWFGAGQPSFPHG